MQRIKGQDVTLTIMRSNTSGTTPGQVGSTNLETTLTDVLSFDATFKFEKLAQRYLGETTMRYDEIFGGVEGKVKLHLHTEDFLNYIVALESRARRTSPGIIFNFIATMSFPNGQSPVITFPDVKFGDVPMSIADGKSFVSLDLDWAAEEFQVSL